MTLQDKLDAMDRACEELLANDMSIGVHDWVNFIAGKSIPAGRIRCGLNSTVTLDTNPCTPIPRKFTSDDAPRLLLMDLAGELNTVYHECEYCDNLKTESFLYTDILKVSAYAHVEAVLKALDKWQPEWDEVKS